MYFLKSYGDATLTALGFFWKAGWAFILGYFISSMIQAFIPKKRLAKHMGEANIKSIFLSTVFGSASSSCSFAALSTARSLVLKGAHFIGAVVFMFASTNLVIELGILIFIFLGWQFLAAEIIGGLVLIIISSILMKLFYPKEWLKKARRKVENENKEIREDFDWKKRIKSKEGWQLVGHKFVSEWKMVWQEILIGFTIAGFVAILVPNSIWSRIFLMDFNGEIPSWIISLENALVGPLVAGLTFIGSMGNIPLATVLNANGVFFGGVMAFIYSDLMVPPLVLINVKYYGKKVALYIAGIMYVSVVLTSLLLNTVFDILNIIPKASEKIIGMTQFKIDYTFWMNIVFIVIAIGLVYLHRKYKEQIDNKNMDHDMDMDSKSIDLKGVITYVFIGILIFGIISYLITHTII